MRDCVVVYVGGSDDIGGCCDVWVDYVGSDFGGG